MGHKRRCQKRVTAAVGPILKFSTGAFSFAFAMESIAIASPRMGWWDGGMVGWDGGWWMGPLSGYCRRQEAAAHGLNGQFKCKLANALAEKARRRCEKQKQKQQHDNDNNNNKQKKFLCLLLVASRGAAHTRPPGLQSLSQRRDRSLKWLDL